MHSDTQRFPHSTVYKCLKVFFDTRVFKAYRYAVYQCLKKPPTFFDTLALWRFDTHVSVQGESNLHQIVVTILCRLGPPFPQGELALLRYWKTPPSPPPFCGKSYYLYRISCMNPLFSPTRKLGTKRDAKWWPSIRCMFDFLWSVFKAHIFAHLSFSARGPFRGPGGSSQRPGQRLSEPLRPLAPPIPVAPLLISASPRCRGAR